MIYILNVIYSASFIFNVSRWLGNLKKLTCIDQSRFYILTTPGEFKNLNITSEYFGKLNRTSNFLTCYSCSYYKSMLRLTEEATYTNEQVVWRKKTDCYFFSHSLCPETAVCSSSMKRVFFAYLQPVTILRKRLVHRNFSVSFSKFLKGLEVKNSLLLLWYIFKNLWTKSLVQSVVVFGSVFTKLWTYKIFNLT